MAAKATRRSAMIPAGLKSDGRALWDAVTGAFELEEHERSLLLQICQTAAIAALQRVIDTLGVDVAIRELGEIRQQRLAYARLVAALRLPGGLDDDDAFTPRRPQRRAIRGVYKIGGMA